MMPHNKAAAGAAFCLLLALAGCGKGKERDVDALDKELVANAGDQSDPALASALEDQIMVDPALTQQKQSANGRPGAAQSQAPVPAVRPPLGGSAAANKGLMRAPAPGASDAAGAGTLGELARSQAAGRANAPAADCYRNLQFSAGWAQRLPAAVPLYPDAQVGEAAGNDAPGCGVRIVSFASGAPLQTLVDYYYTHARRGGYSAQHKLSGSEHVLGGDKGRAAFLVTFRPHRSGGTDVDLVATLER